MKGPRRTFLSAFAALGLVPHPARRAGAAQAPSTPPAGGAAEGLLAAARSRYGLTPEEAAEVRKGIEQILGAADSLRGHPLANSDEPALTFEARPPSLRGPSRR